MKDYETENYLICIVVIFFITLIPQHYYKIFFLST